ncbi:MAG: phosphoenolpyruvate carboxykinase (GTP) [Candidatus Stahlbacteria bacterium]|nr:phosphoenolpyruvate carboxykinase (GTP) [Candidatus Stahlbacteria bacterium]
MTNKCVSEWIKEMASLCQPDSIYWCDGSIEEKERLQQEAINKGELIELNQAKLPGCFYHRTALNDVARTEQLTFICTPDKEDAGPTNNWMSPDEGYRRAGAIFSGSMKGRTMYVIPFSMGPVGSPFSKIGIQLTDSIYVVLNMRIVTRMGKVVTAELDKRSRLLPKRSRLLPKRSRLLPKGVDFTRCLHSIADLDVNRRLILHFPQDNTIWSVGSGYGGNALLGKKCLSLRIASYIAQKEGWLAEHMLIMGIEGPNGNVDYIAAAFPSACGKTNLAMLIPPMGLKHKGYRIWTVGDDIAWMRIGSDGALWAVNPEFGIFGVAPGTNSKTNPTAMATIQSDTIYTNVVLKPDKTVWWEGGDGPIPDNGLDWQGRQWKPGMTDATGTHIKGAHPNSRFTAPITNCPSVSHCIEQHQGVPISAIIFGGRRARLAPLVYESFNWQHGVFVGATMASERTAAQYGALGEVRRDPMAMLPFCGYNMADYFGHWLKMGNLITKPPLIFNVNWFRTDENNNFLWPGYGENLRVLEWIINRCNGKVESIETPIGYVPDIKDMDMTGLDIDTKDMERLLEINPNDWLGELKSIRDFFAQFGDRLPSEIWDEYKALEKRLQRR